MAHLTHAGHAPVIWTGRAREMVEVLRHRIARRRVYRQSLRELRALPNRALADLGLNRSTLRRAALEAAYGRDADQV
ncbi:MAG: DUF1127 domain-containing protein [Rhodobacteraceae bacterium]|nr:DUF1127 domain-containing protein [Paracoccaceae bacterium]